MLSVPHSLRTSSFVAIVCAAIGIVMGGAIAAHASARRGKEAGARSNLPVVSDVFSAVSFKGCGYSADRYAADR